MRQPRAHLNFEVLSQGLEPLSEAEISEMQLRSKKKKRVSTGFQIRRKKRFGYGTTRAKATNQISSRREISEDLIEPKNAPMLKDSHRKSEMGEMDLETLQDSENFDPETLNSDESRWLIPSGWKLILYVKFWSNSLIETEDLFVFDNYECLFNGFHHGFPLRVKGQTSYPTVKLDPTVIFARVRETRGSRILKNCFVLNENLFEFGPLFISNEGEEPEKLKFTEFCFSNNTTFDVHMTFTFLRVPRVATPAKNSKKPVEPPAAKDKTPPRDEVFSVEHAELRIAPGETELLKVFAKPIEEKVYRNSLICCIRENPQPLIIPLKCEGQYPRVTLSTKVIDFGRLLVGKHSVRQVIIRNVSLLPVKWHIKSDVGDFDIDKQSGVLMADQEEVLSVRFDAQDQVKLEHQIEIEVEDNDGRGLINEELQELTLHAEGFFIRTELGGFDGPENFFDFGDVQVAHEVEKSFQLENKGIYPIRYAVDIFRKQFKNVFRIEPSKGVLEPEESISVRVIFRSSGEIFLKSKDNRKEMSLKIIENSSGEVYEEHRLRLKVNSQFSQFSLSPLKSLNFSAIIFGETKTKYFQIQNTGLFDFHFCICEWKHRAQGKLDLIQQIESGPPSESSGSKSRVRTNPRHTHQKDRSQQRARQRVHPTRAQKRVFGQRRVAQGAHRLFERFAVRDGAAFVHFGQQSGLQKGAQRARVFGAGRGLRARNQYHQFRFHFRGANGGPQSELDGTQHSGRRQRQRLFHGRKDLFLWTIDPIEVPRRHSGAL